MRLYLAAVMATGIAATACTQPVRSEADPQQTAASTAPSSASDSVRQTPSVLLADIAVEGPYRDTWSAILVAEGPRLYVAGEGKTVDFHGIVTLNCENGKASWHAAGNFIEGGADPDKFAEAVVPPQVMRKAHQLFCAPA